MANVLTFPADALGEVKLSLDYGGSLVKIAYLNPSSDGKICEVRTQTFLLSEQEKCMAFLRGLGPWKPGEIVATGIRLQEFKGPLKEVLGTSYRLFHEFTGLINCFRWLVRTRPKHEVVIETCEESVIAGEDTILKTHAAQTKWIGTDQQAMLIIADPLLSKDFYRWYTVEADREAPYMEADPELYPCILAMLGSGGVIMKLDADDNDTFLNIASRSGRSLLGLASLFLGIKDFDEIMDLAGKGDSNNLDISWGDFASNETEDDGHECYNSGLEGDYVVHSYGKALGKHMGCYSRGDVMRALLSNLISELAHIVMLEAELHGVRRVFFTGGLTTHPLIRHEFIRHISMHKVFKPKSRVEYSFLSHAGHFPAIGALLRTKKDHE